MSSDLPQMPDASLQSALVEIAHRLTARQPRTSGSRSQQILERLTVAAVASVPGADYAGLTMHHHSGRLISRAPSDPQISDLDQLQVTLAEGPCVDAIAPGTSTVVVVTDFVGEPRWSRFSPAVAAHGIRSLLSFTMAPHQASPAALNLYSTRPCAFDDVDQAIGAVFAQQAAVAVYGAGVIAALERALHTRNEIGQATGILIERFGVTAQTAFDLLVESSQHSNSKLADVAHRLVSDATTRGLSPAQRDGSPRHARPRLRQQPDTPA